MSQQQNNTISLEDLAIQKALAKGHKNPRACERHQSCLTAGGVDRKIIDYKILEISKIIDDNVRIEDIDVKRCEDEIAPLIQEKFKTSPETMGLNYPLFVEKRGKEYKMVHGHNRKYCMYKIFKHAKVPVFVLDNQGSVIDKLKGAILANKKLEDDPREYKMIDVVLQMQKFENLSYFSNISDAKKTREEFEILMNEIHEFQFKAQKTRTRIFNMWMKKTTQHLSPFVTWNKDYEDLVISRNGYTSRYSVNSSNKRTLKRWLSHVDHSQKAIVGFSNTNGHVTRANMFTLLEKWQDPKFVKMNSGNSIHLIVNIYGAESNLTDLISQEDAHLKQLQVINNILSSFTGDALIIEKVIFPARLVSQKGKDRIINWDKKQKKFV